jgi:hypothetical protein
VKLLERRASMLGTNAPTRVYIVVEQTTAGQPDSTSQLLAELDRIAAERNPNGVRRPILRLPLELSGLRWLATFGRPSTFIGNR